MGVDCRLFLLNRITGMEGIVPPTIKNGSGGAPAVEEDPRFPMANSRIASRFRFWRTSASPPSQVRLDFDFTGSLSTVSAGVTRIARYRGGSGFGELKVYSGPSGSYPPTWTLRATIAVSPTSDPDLFADYSSASGRYWRFEFNSVVGQFSCKPWLVSSTDRVTLTQGGAGAAEVVRRVREKERESFLGGKIFNDLGIGIGEKLREFRIPFPLLTTAQLAAIRTSQRGNCVFQHHDGSYCEVRHLEPDVPWTQYPGSTARYQGSIALAQLP